METGEVLRTLSQRTKLSTPGIESVSESSRPRVGSRARMPSHRAFIHSLMGESQT